MVQNFQSIEQLLLFSFHPLIHMTANPMTWVDGAILAVNLAAKISPKFFHFGKLYYAFALIDFFYVNLPVFVHLRRLKPSWLIFTFSTLHRIFRYAVRVQVLTVPGN